MPPSTALHPPREICPPSADLTGVALELLKNLELFFAPARSARCGDRPGRADSAPARRQVEASSHDAAARWLQRSAPGRTAESRARETPRELGSSVTARVSNVSMRRRSSGSGTRPLSPPEAQRIVKMRHRISRVRLDETREPLGHLWRKFGCDAVNFAKKIVWPRIGRIEIDRPAERRDGLAVLPREYCAIPNPIWSRADAGTAQRPR